MQQVLLEFPTIKHKEQAEAMKQEFFDANEPIINGSALLDQMDYDAWLENTIRNSNPATAREDWVPATTFFAVRKSDKKIIGIVDIRHNLNQEFLTSYGGHIGYAVRPSERRKGYATQILTKALDYARELGVRRIMLGCYADNLASIRTIEKCGGMRTETKKYIDGRLMNVYWFE